MIVMRLKQIYTVLLCLTLISVVSCDIDDVVPQNALVEDNVIRDEKSANEMLNGAYEKLRGFNSSMKGIHLALLSGELVQTGSIVGVEGFETNNVMTDNDWIQGFYKECYEMINQSNWIIEQLSSEKEMDITAERRATIIAEAKTLRAMGHFYLLRTFGQFYDLNSQYGIVIRNKPAKSLETKERSSVQTSYDFIVKDLNDAILEAPAGVGHSYISASVAQAQLAKVQLYMGNYADASGNALAVINNTDAYKLEASYSNIFANRMNSEEVLLAPYVDGVTEGSTSMTQIARTAQSPYFQALADKQVGADDDGDIANGTGFDPRFIVAYSNTHLYQNQNGKYPLMNRGEGSGNTTYYLRMAEVYLIYAEAEARLATDIGDANALAAIARVNELRSRAGGIDPIAPANLTELKNSIREEKLLELFAETGESWFDLVRYHRLGDVNASDIKPTITNDNQLVLPIPLKALAGNNKLIPNPGY